MERHTLDIKKKKKTKQKTKKQQLGRLKVNISIWPAAWYIAYVILLQKFLLSGYNFYSVVFNVISSCVWSKIFTVRWKHTIIIFTCEDSDMVSGFINSAVFAFRKKAYKLYQRYESYIPPFLFCIVKTR